MISDQKKIIILEKDHTRKDYLRSVFEANEGLTFCFDRVAACFDNLTRLNPDLIVVGSITRSGVLRFINAHNATGCRLPSLLMTQDQMIKKYLKTGGINNIQVYDANLDSIAINRSIADVLLKSSEISHPNNIAPIIGCSPCMVRVKETLPELNRSKECILIEGEVGTGKETVARAIHCLTDSQDNFIKISSGNLDPGTERIGLFEVIKKIRTNKIGADPKPVVTVYIHEINHLPYSLQAEFLDIFHATQKLNDESSQIQTGKIRFIASTSVGSEYLQSAKSFRQDLFYRLNVLNFKIEPLRKRKEDIPLLTDFFSYRLCNMLGRSFFELPEETIEIFMKYHWPGNIAELESVVKRMVIYNDDTGFLKKVKSFKSNTLLNNHDMNLEELAAIEAVSSKVDDLHQNEKLTLKDICSEFLSKIEKKVIIKALRSTNWNRKKAAALLNISYKTILNKIKEYGLAA